MYPAAKAVSCQTSGGGKWPPGDDRKSNEHRLHAGEVRRGSHLKRMKIWKQSVVIAVDQMLLVSVAEN